MASSGLPSLVEQAKRLVDSGVLAHANDLSAPELMKDARELELLRLDDALLVVHENNLPPSAFAAFLKRETASGVKAGFVVEDMTDVDLFLPVSEDEVAHQKVYVISGLSRGDDLRGLSPEEAVSSLEGRLPLRLAEGMHWVFQDPAVLEPGACFMTIGSRLRKANGGWDARTPALWISGGTGRDGRSRKGAPKVGWCWWRNRHDWLGFASATSRVTL